MSDDDEYDVTLASLLNDQQEHSRDSIDDAAPVLVERIERPVAPVAAINREERARLAAQMPTAASEYIQTVLLMVNFVQLISCR